MRLLHAGHHDEPVRAYQRGEPATARALRPACRQSLPLHRLSADPRRGAGHLQRRPSIGSPQGRGARAALAALVDDAMSSSATRALFRCAGQRRWRRSMRAFPTRCWSAAPPTSACGSPRCCAIARSSGSGASPGSIDRGRRGSSTSARPYARGRRAAAAELHPDLGEMMRRFGSRRCEPAAPSAAISPMARRSAICRRR